MFTNSDGRLIYTDIIIDYDSLSVMPKEPPSLMIRVPSPLVDAVRELSRLHRAGRTKAVLSGVERLVCAIDSEQDVDIDSVLNLISKFSERIERLESGSNDSDSVASLISERFDKLEADVGAIAMTVKDLVSRVEDLEGESDLDDDSDIDSGTITDEDLLLPLSQSALAQRLMCSDNTIGKQRKLGKEKFARWSRERDPDRAAWTWEGSGGRGQPLRFMPM